MPVTTVRDETHFQSCLASAGPKLVVVDFTAKWCGPCRQIAPIYENLSIKYPRVVFLKVDVDDCDQVAASNSVKAMPTFIFFRARTRVARIQGANPQALEEKIVELAGQESSSSGESSSGQSYGPHIDLNTFITKGGCECLNESDDHPLAHCLDGRKDTYLESDCDEQLIITISFSQPIKLHSLRLRAPAGFGPKTLKLFLNQPTSLDFDKAESSEPVQAVQLTAEDLVEEARPVQLKYVKFQNVNSLTIFVSDNQSGEETTRINNLILIGSPVAATNMNEFKRIGGKQDCLMMAKMPTIPDFKSMEILSEETATDGLYAGPRICRNVWSNMGIYVYLCMSIILIIIGLFGMFTTAYNRGGSKKRRIYSTKGI